MLLKDLLDKESDDKDKDVNITIDTKAYNTIANQLQSVLFPCNPWKVLYDLNEKKKEMKKMKKDETSSLIFLTSEEIKKHEEWSHGPCRYYVNVLKLAWKEAGEKFKNNQLYFNRAIINHHFNRVDIYFSVRSEDDNQWEREERLNKINTPYYKVRIVYPDNYVLYDSRFNMIWTTDAEYDNEYAIYDIDNYQYFIYLTENKTEWVPFIFDKDAKYKETPDTYDISGEDYGDDDDDN